MSIFALTKFIYMKFKFTFTLLAFLFLTSISGQTKLNMELLAHIDWQEQGSGCWGYTDSKGTEYAVIGTRKAIRILSLEDPKNPVDRLVIPGATNTWREARAFGNYIYVTTEGPDGVTIIDCTEAPEKFTWKRWKPAINIGANDTIRSVHSINMDDFGHMYLNGTNVPNRGVLIFDVNKDGYNPELVANVGNVYTHDCYATKDFLYTADLSNGIGVYDIKDIKNPVFINRFATSLNFTHNMWTSPDEKFLYSTDERSGAFLDAYDITDKKNVKFISKYQNEDTNKNRVIPHNVYSTKDLFTVTSWYTDGVLINDVSRPDNIVKVGEFDTYMNEATLSQTGSWFEGCWGVYPFLKSGTIVASDINTGLWIFKPTYNRACWLEGKTLVEDENGVRTPIVGAKVTIKAIRYAASSSNQSGIYKTGIAESGLYKVYFSHPDYKPDSVELTLENGVVANHDFVVKGLFMKVNINDKNGKGISGAKANVVSTNSNLSNQLEADANGLVKFSINPDAKYTIQAAAWGYKGQVVSDVIPGDNVSITLEKGYQDDFFVDLGWTNTLKTTTGNWERVKPLGTIDNSKFCNPNEDAAGDIGDQAYVTGNGGANPGDNDVDGGATVLQSPIMDFSSFNNAKITYDKWFYNSGGNTTPNDNLIVYLHNGIDSILIETFNTSLSLWTPSEHDIADSKIKFTNSMRLIFIAEDSAPGHLVESGVDAVNVELSTLSSTSDNSVNKLKLAPNPVSNNLFVIGDANIRSIEINDLSGRLLMKGNNSVINVESLQKGLYIARIIDVNGDKFSLKFAKN